MDKKNKNLVLSWILPTKGWIKVKEEAPELLLLPIPLLGLIVIHWGLILIPIILLWGIGTLYWEN